MKESGGRGPGKGVSWCVEPTVCLREHTGLSFISPLMLHISREIISNFKDSMEADFSIWALLMS